MPHARCCCLCRYIYLCRLLMLSALASIMPRHWYWLLFHNAFVVYFYARSMPATLLLPASAVICLRLSIDVYALVCWYYVWCAQRVYTVCSRCLLWRDACAFIALLLLTPDTRVSMRALRAFLLSPCACCHFFCLPRHALLMPAIDALSIRLRRRCYFALFICCHAIRCWYAASCYFFFFSALMPFAPAALLILSDDAACFFFSCYYLLYAMICYAYAMPACFHCYIMPLILLFAPCFPRRDFHTCFAYVFHYAWCNAMRETFPWARRRVVERERVVLDAIYIRWGAFHLMLLSRYAIPCWRRHAMPLTRCHMLFRAWCWWRAVSLLYEFIFRLCACHAISLSASRLMRVLPYDYWCASLLMPMLFLPRAYAASLALRCRAHWLSLTPPAACRFRVRCYALICRYDAYCWWLRYSCATRCSLARDACCLLPARHCLPSWCLPRLLYARHYVSIALHVRHCCLRRACVDVLDTRLKETHILLLCSLTRLLWFSRFIVLPVCVLCYAYACLMLLMMLIFACQMPVVWYYCRLARARLMTPRLHSALRLRACCFDAYAAIWCWVRAYGDMRYARLHAARRAHIYTPPEPACFTAPVYGARFYAR